MKVKNKLLVVALAIVAALCMASTAFATTISASPASVKAGDTVTVAVSIEEDMTNVLTCAYDVYFDDQSFEYVGGSIGNASSLTKISDLKMDGGAHLSVSVLDVDSVGVDVKAGTLCTLTFKAKDGITDPAAFTLVRGGFLFGDFTDHADEGTVSAGSASVAVSSDSDDNAGTGGDEGDGSGDNQGGAGDGTTDDGTQGGAGDGTTGEGADGKDDATAGDSNAADDDKKSDSAATAKKPAIAQTGDGMMLAAGGLGLMAIAAAAAALIARKKGLIG